MEISAYENMIFVYSWCLYWLHWAYQLRRGAASTATCRRCP